MKLSVDRIENGIAVCYDDNCKKCEIPAHGLSEGVIIEAEFDENDKFVRASVLAEETEVRRKNLAARTKNLFNRKKK